MTVSFIGEGNQGKQSTDLSPDTDKLYHTMSFLVNLPISGFEIVTTLQYGTKKVKTFNLTTLKQLQ